MDLNVHAINGELIRTKSYLLHPKRELKEWLRYRISEDL